MRCRRNPQQCLDALLFWETISHERRPGHATLNTPTERQGFGLGEFAVDPIQKRIEQMLDP
jgi:hypothetical protein